MAGQRMTYGNVQTNIKGLVSNECAVYLTGTTTLSPSLVVGPGFTVTGINTTTFTVYVPERYTLRNVSYINLIWANGTTLLADAVISTGYTTPSTGVGYLQVQVLNWTSAAAIVNPIGTLYVTVDDQLGM